MRDVVVAVFSAIFVFGSVAYMGATAPGADLSCVAETQDLPPTPMARVLFGDDADAVSATPAATQRLALGRTTD